MTEEEQKVIPVKGYELTAVMQRCKHTDFFVYAAVNIIEDTGKFAADITVRCADCEMPFQFLGLPVGLNMEGAAVSVDRTEARLAIVPYDRRNIDLLREKE